MDKIKTLDTSDKTLLEQVVIFLYLNHKNKIIICQIQAIY